MTSLSYFEFSVRGGSIDPKELKAAMTSLGFEAKNQKENIKATCGNQYIHEPRKDLGAKEHFFTGSIDTDGTSVCLHFRRGLRENEIKIFSEKS